MTGGGWGCLLPALTARRPRCFPSPYRRGIAMSILNGEGRVQGSGVGTPRHAAISGAGELLERRCLFASIAPTARGRLGELSDRSMAASLRRALQQLGDQGAERIEAHPFQLTCVHRLGESFTSQLYPTALLTLTSTGLEADRPFVPFIDSSGSCLHRTQELALEGAIDEFIERQLLLAAWFGVHAHEIRLCTRDVRAIGGRAADLDLLARLTGNGTLRLFTVPSPFGRHHVLAIYEGRERGIHFSVGSACSGLPVIALRKALMELWHGVVYQAAHVDRLPPWELDVLKVGFLAANRPGTAAHFPPWGQAGGEMSANDFLGQPPVPLSATLNLLHDWSSNLVAYQRREAGRHFCRVASPDFYVHFNPGVALNFDNRSATLMGMTHVPAQQLTQIPFP
jgi:hypothetical protein